MADARRTLALWRREYNNVRPHSSLGNKTPAEARRAIEQSDDNAPGALAQPETDHYQPQGLSSGTRDNRGVGHQLHHFVGHHPRLRFAAGYQRADTQVAVQLRQSRKRDRRLKRMKQSSGSRIPWRRQATITACCSMLRTGECGSVRPMVLSVTTSGLRHFWTVARLIEQRCARALTPSLLRCIALLSAMQGVACQAKNG